MLTEKIGEPIRVIASFSAGAVKPVRFHWQGRTYQVESINGQWLDRQANNYSLHYSVQAGQETYYIHFSSQDVQWWLDEVILDG